MIPTVVVEAPPGWSAAEIPRPPLAEGSGASFTQWTAWQSPSGTKELVAACVATPIPGWVEDLRPSVEARTTGLALHVGERLVGAPVTAQTAGESLRLVATDAPPGLPAAGLARTFIGFPAPESGGPEGGRVFTCFVACASRRGHEAETPLECEENVVRTKLDGAGPPPPPGLVLQAATWSVHHSRPVGIGGAGLAALAGVLAVLTRRRPRTRI